MIHMIDNIKISFVELGMISMFLVAKKIVYHNKASHTVVLNHHIKKSFFISLE